MYSEYGSAFTSKLQVLPEHSMVQVRNRKECSVLRTPVQRRPERAQEPEPLLCTFAMVEISQEYATGVLVAP